MKTKIPFSILLSFVFYLLSSQVPQGFNYQAIARDVSGNPIANATIKVMLSILSDSTGFYQGTISTDKYIWEEEQTGVKTNAFGLFTIVFGKTPATKIQGSATSFSAIDWAKGQYYIGTKIANPDNYKIMGAAKLWSVPYSMLSDSSKALLKGSKLSVVSSDDGDGSALFEVKRKDGQTVFAVYPTAVNIYVPRVTAKGTKGGFAIGGFDGTKTDPQDYFRVTPDSVRVYIDKTPDIPKGTTKGGFAIGGFDQSKGGGGGIQLQDLLTVGYDSIRMYINDLSTKGATKGGFAIGGFENAKGNASNYLNVATDESGLIIPPKNRILWYPIKNAFLAGRIRIGSQDSVGENSFATGYESKAQGKYSQAMGFKSITSGQNSTAIGNNTLAEGPSSFAMGESTKSSGNSSTSMGIQTWAQGDYSTTMGYQTHTIGVGATAIGYGTIASGNYATAMGRFTTASDDDAVSFGYHNTARGWASTVMGYNSDARGQWSTAIGYQDSTTNGATGSIALGYDSKADAIYSAAIGAWNTTIGEASASIGGYGNEAHGNESFATGLWSKTFGTGAFAGGVRSIATGGPSFAFGTDATTSQSNSLSVGNATHAGGESAVALGSGTTASQDRSFAVGSSSQASGYAACALGESTVASGDFSAAMGYHTTASNWNSVVFGRYNILTGSNGNGTDPMFVIGNGSNDGARSNAITVLHNGNLGIGTHTPDQKLTINGNLKFIDGYLQIINGKNKNIIQSGWSSGWWNYTMLSSSWDWSGTKSPGSVIVSEQYPLLVTSGNNGTPNAYQYLMVNSSGSVYMPSVYSQDVGPTNIALYIDSDGKLGYNASSIRYKENITDIDNINWLYKLRPVVYNYKGSKPDELQFGLIAEEVEVISPLLVIYNKENKADGLKYEKLSVPMLKAIQEQEKQIVAITGENLQLKSELQSLKDEIEQMKAILLRAGIK